MAGILSVDVLILLVDSQGRHSCEMSNYLSKELCYIGVCKSDLHKIWVVKYSTTYS